MIPYGRQEISQADIDAVTAVLRSDWLTQGPAVPSFEAAVANQVGARHAVAVNSATSALHVACLALGLGPGDRLWTVPNTFVASANCGLYCGATVDFVDIELVSGNIDVALLAEKLASAAQMNCLPKILVPVHFAGHPVEQQAIRELTERYGVFIVEDASHAVGARHNGEPIGNCRWSDITVFSFHPVKIITSGEGGMALTNDPELAWRMQLLRSHGITRDPERMAEANPPAWYYEQQELGFNYRMTDIHAALGQSQMARLDGWIARRNEIARYYDELLSGLGIGLPVTRFGNLPAWHLYVVRVEPGQRRRIFESMRAAGVAVNVHYMPVHLQPYYRKLGFCAGALPVAEAHGREALTLPMFPGLSDTDVERVAEKLKHALGN